MPHDGENSNGNYGNVMRMTSFDDDNDDMAVDTGAPQAQLASADEPMMEDEIVDKVGAYEKLQEMRVTLEQAGIANNVNKNPPNTARQVLSGLRVNKQMMTHCITGETDNTKVQRYYTNQRPIPNGRGGGDKLFDVPKLGPNSGRSMRQNTAVFHKIYENDEAVTVPIIKMKMFIEQANTGSELPLVMFFMFLCVEVPLTFDFVDTVYRSCTKNAIGRENFIGDDMKRIVNIAHRHQTFSGSGKKTLESMLQIQFNDIFDPDSPNCFWKMFHIPRCIQ